MPDLLMDLDIARSEGTYRKVMAKYANPVLLILDEWMLLKPTDTEQKDIFELLHRRRKKSSTIFCSQYVFGEWYDQLGGEASPLADAIIDRIAHDSYQINITSIDAKHDKSMREIYGLDKNITRVNSQDDFRFRTSDFQISGSAISSHKNIHFWPTGLLVSAHRPE